MSSLEGFALHPQDAHPARLATSGQILQRVKEFQRFLSLITFGVYISLQMPYVPYRTLLKRTRAQEIKGEKGG